MPPTEAVWPQFAMQVFYYPCLGDENRSLQRFISYCVDREKDLATVLKTMLSAVVASAGTKIAYISNIIIYTMQ